MTNQNTNTDVTYEQFRNEWLAEIEDENLSPLEKGRRFGAKLVSQWLDVTVEDDDFVILDGSGDGGIDIAYLQRRDIDPPTNDTEAIEGDTWYIVQSKYGTAFSGSDTIMQEGTKVISTLRGQNQNLSSDAQKLMQKLDLFRKQATDADALVLVFATTDPISQQDRQALDDIKTLGRSEKFIEKFDVQEVSLHTIYEMQDDAEASKISVPIKGTFVEQSSNLLVGTVPLMDLFNFLKAYQKRTGNLDQLYEKNVRQFLGNRRKINRAIAGTLNTNPDKFGLYNNGITIVVSSFSKSSSDNTVTVNDPYVVNGCQTTRSIWDVLDSKLQAGGSGKDATTEKWKELVSRGGVVTKIVSSDEAEILNITRFTNSQNSVREQDFLALDVGFRSWASAMGEEYNIFLEIQRGGTASRKALEKSRPDVHPMDDYVNAFDLIKVYGAGWLGEPGLAFKRNASFLPHGSVYERMINRKGSQPAFGSRDLYAAYKIKCATDNIGFGRNAELPSRRQSRFLFYRILLRMLSNVILMTPQFSNPPVSESVLTDAVLKLAADDNEAQFDTLCNAALSVVDQYLTVGSESNNTAYKEISFNKIHNGDLNGFLKAEGLSKDRHSPLLVQLIEQTNQMFASYRVPTPDGPSTQQKIVQSALIKN